MDIPVDQWGERLSNAVAELVQYAMSGESVPMEIHTIEFEIPAPIANVVAEIAEDAGKTQEEILSHMASAGLNESINSILNPDRDRVQEVRQESGELNKDMSDIQDQFSQLQNMMEMVPKLQEAVNALQGLKVPDGTDPKDNT